MLDFCAQRGLVLDIEAIRMDKIEAACERMLQSNVKYRLVVDRAMLPISQQPRPVQPAI